MTKEAAFYNFFSSFSIPAYEEFSVPDNAEMPYITYNANIGYYGSGEVSVTANLWYRGTSNTIINSKSNEIAQYIGLGGVLLGCDDGIIWLKRENNFSQAMSDTDYSVKRRYLQMSAEYV